MVKLRKAEFSDFEEYKEMHENNDLHFLYNSATVLTPEEEEEADRACKLFFGEEFLKELEEFIKCTPEKFRASLESEVIYIAENEGKVVGYIGMFYCGNGRYKIADWALKDPEDDELKVQMFQELLKAKVPRCKKFVVTLLNSKAIKLVGSLGFKESRSGTAFFEFEIQKKKRGE